MTRSQDRLPVELTSLAPLVHSFVQIPHHPVGHIRRVARRSNLAEHQRVADHYQTSRMLCVLLDEVVGERVLVWLRRMAFPVGKQVGAVFECNALDMATDNVEEARTESSVSMDVTSPVGVMSTPRTFFTGGSLFAVIDPTLYRSCWGAVPPWPSSQVTRAMVR